MAAIEPPLVAVLRTLVPKVYADFAPFGAPRPYAFYQFIGGPPIRYLDNTSNAKQQTVQISVWADSRQQADDLMRAIETAMCAAATFTASPNSEMTTDADPESERYGASQDFAVFWRP